MKSAKERPHISGGGEGDTKWITSLGIRLQEILPFPSNSNTAVMDWSFSYFTR